RRRDLFVYRGGVGAHADGTGARTVVAVSLSAAALALAEQNARLNGFEGLSYVREDVFSYLQSLAQAGERFGLIVLDPPKFARARNAVEEALRGYRRLPSLGLRLAESDAILVTCSFSGLISLPMLE